LGYTNNIELELINNQQIKEEQKMKRLSNWLKSLRPVKILAATFIGMVLFISQACDAASATKPDTEKSEYYAPKDVKARSPYEGGMNNFSDVDPRAKDAKTEAKVNAQSLKGQAESNIGNKGSINAVENIRRVANDSGKLGRNIQDKAESATDKLGEETGSFVDSAKQGLKNIKNNAQDAPGYISDKSERAFGNPLNGIKEGTKDAGNAVKRTLKEADDKSSKSAYDTGRNLDQKGETLIEEARQAVKDVLD
jgi:hypothetical protein